MKYIKSDGVSVNVLVGVVGGAEQILKLRSGWLKVFELLVLKVSSSGPGAGQNV